MPGSYARNILSAMAETRRFTGAGRLKSMREDMACCLMKLLQTRLRHLPDIAVKYTHLKTRASDVSPAIAMPTWSSIRYIFCWYEASSPNER